MFGADQIVEVRGAKWPRRPTGMARAHLLGEDRHGRWLGVPQGAPWWMPDGAQGGVFERALVKVVPSGTFWTACFHPVDPVVDVDITLPARWAGAVLEEVDLELDVQRSAAGAVWVRDEDRFAQVRQEWAMPDAVAEQALATCAQLVAQVAGGAEPFASVGQAWLARFLAGEVGQLR